MTDDVIAPKYHRGPRGAALLACGQLGAQDGRHVHLIGGVYVKFDADLT